MNIWGILGLAIVILSALTGAYYTLESYIDYKANLIANNAILESKVTFQNQMLLEKKLLEEKYKNNVKVIEKRIEVKVPQIQTQKDSACEAKLQNIEAILNSLWIENNDSKL